MYRGSYLGAPTYFYPLSSQANPTHPRAGPRGSQAGAYKTQRASAYTKQVRVEAERLLLQAQEDLASARVLFQGARFYAAAFFAQQTAEKALKALYIERFLKLPRTHDLIELAEALGAETGLLEQARLLTPDYLLTRYPDAAGTVPARLYRQDEARDRLKAAKEIL